MPLIPTRAVPRTLAIGIALALPTHLVAARAGKKVLGGAASGGFGGPPPLAESGLLGPVTIVSTASQ